VIFLLVRVLVILVIGVRIALTRHAPRTTYLFVVMESATELLENAYARMDGSVTLVSPQ